MPISFFSLIIGAENTIFTWIILETDASERNCFLSENSLTGLADQQFLRFPKTQWGGDYVKIVNVR